MRLDHDWMRFVKRPIKSQAAPSHSADWLGDPIVMQRHSRPAINYQQGCDPGQLQRLAQRLVVNRAQNPMLLELIVTSAHMCSICEH